MLSTDKALQLDVVDLLDSQGNLGAQAAVGNAIIDYIEPAKTFGRDDLCDPAAKGRYQRRMIAVPDRRGITIEPMVLTLGKQQRLSLVRRSDEGSAGWESIELQRKVQAFGAAWSQVDGTDKVTLAVAVDAGNGVSRLLVAFDVDAASADWHTLPWVDYGSREALRIDGIRVLRGTDNVWNLLLSAGQDDKQQAYLIRSDRGPSLATDSIVFNTATGLSEIHDFGLGIINGNSALHVIGVGRNTTALALQARLLPTAHKGESSTAVYPYVCPPGAKSLALGHPRKRGNDLYVAGNGVIRLPAEQLLFHRTARSEPVIAPELASDIRQVCVCENQAGVASVWALQGNGNLLLTHRESADQPWSHPQHLRPGVIDLAPVEGDEHITTGVLVVYQDGRAGHLRRDHQGIWQETQILVADPEESSSITCFSTHLTLTDSAGLPWADATLKLRASVLTTLVINGTSTVVGPEAIDVKTDPCGMLRLFNRAMSFTPATYQISIQGWPELVEINPAAPLYERFETISASELQHAEMPGGQGFLLPEQYRKKEALNTVQTLLSAVRQVGSLAVGSGSSGVQLRTSNSTFSSRQVALQLQEGHYWGLSSTVPGELTTLPPEQARALTVTAGAAALPGQSLSDVLEGLWAATTSAFNEAVSFVIGNVNGVVECVLEVAGKVKRFVLDTLEKIGAFLKWAWQSVCTIWEKVCSYAKYLFAWKDITAMRHTMATLVDEEMTVLVGHVSSLKNLVGPAFESAIEAIREQCVKLDVRRRDRRLSAAGTGSLAKQLAKPQNKKLDVTGSGPGGAAMDLLGKIIELIVKVELPPASQEFATVEDLLESQLKVLSSLGTHIQDDFAYIFKDGFSLADLDLDKVQRIILSLVLNVAEAVTTATRNVFMHLIDTLAQMIDTIRRVLFARISFPFIEKTIGLFTDEPVSVSVRLIDVLLFVPSILATVTCKLFLDEKTMKAGLLSRLPSTNGLASQSSEPKSAFGFMTDVMSTYVGLGMLFYDMVPAMAGPKVQKVTGMLDVAGWGFSLVLLVYKNPWRSTRTKTPEAQNFEAAAYGVNVMQVLFGFQKLRRNWSKYMPTDPVAALNQASIYPPIEMIMLTIHTGIKIAQWGADDNETGTGDLETIQLIARNSAKTALKSCLINDEDNSRSRIALGAVGAGFAFDYMIGMIRHGLSRPG